MRAADGYIEFLRCAHRRWVTWRGVEQAGIGMLIGALAGLPVVLVLVWRQQPSAMTTAAVLLAIGAAAGAVFGLSRRPTLLETAMQVDRQFGLHDLLSTALLHQSRGDEQFVRVVETQAAVVCRGLSPSALAVRRLGGRAWGGIGVVSGLLLAASLLSVGPRPSIAAAPGPGETIELFTPASEPQPERPALVSSSGVAGKSPSREATGGPGAAATERDPSEAPGDPSRAARSASLGGGDGTGQRSGTTPDGQMAPLQLRGSALPPAGQATGELNASGLADPPRASRPVPPWRSATWPADREAAARELQSGRVPDAYRDLVREYFDRADRAP